MSTEERDTLIANINTQLVIAAHTRNTLRDAVSRAQRNESMCAGGRHEVYEKLGLNSHGVTEPAGRYDDSAPAHEVVQEFVHPEWYKDAGLRGMEQHLIDTQREYVEMARNWLAANYERAVSRRFITELFAELGWGELPTQPKDVYLYVEYRFKLSADTNEDEDSLRAKVKENLNSLILGALDDDDVITNDYVSVTMSTSSDE